MPSTRQQLGEHLFAKAVGLGFGSGTKTNALQGAHTFPMKQSLRLLEFGSGYKNHVLP